MRFILTVFFLICPLYSAQAKIIALATPERTKAELAKPGPRVLLYYTHWCGACREFLPTYQEASDRLSGVRFYAIDADKLALKEHVKRFNHIPTAYVGRTETELRNHPCEILQGDRTINSVLDEIKACLKVK